MKQPKPHHSQRKSPKVIEDYNGDDNHDDHDEDDFTEQEEEAPADDHPEIHGEIDEDSVEEKSRPIYVYRGVEYDSKEDAVAARIDHLINPRNNPAVTAVVHVIVANREKIIDILSELTYRPRQEGK